MGKSLTIHTTAADLRRVLGATAPFAAPTGYGLPSLEAVQLAAGGGVLAAVATDRYVVGYARAAAQTETPCRFLLQVDHADAIRKALTNGLKERERDFPVTATISDEGRDRQIAFAFEPYWMTFNEAAGAASVPDLKEIIDEQVQPGASPAAGPVGINPRALKPFLKAAKYVDECQPLRWSFGDAMKPARVEIEEWFVGLVMPVRLRDNQKAVECVMPAPASKDGE